MATVTEKELLETLIKKLGDSSALNGGFDKLVLMIEHVQERQEDSNKKLDKVSEALYDPDTGLFSRVKKIEQKLDTNIDELEKKVRVVPDVKSEVEDLKKFQASLESIAGKQLEELQSLVKLRKNLSNIYWALLVSLAGLVADFIFNLARHH